MSDVWSERAQAFRESPTHREGPDLDLVDAAQRAVELAA